MNKTSTTKLNNSVAPTAKAPIIATIDLSKGFLTGIANLPYI